MSQYDTTFDLKMNVGHCDLYFIVQWFYLISCRLFDIWTPYFGIMSQYDPVFDLKIFVAHCDLYFMVQWFCLISWKLFSGRTSYFGIMSQYDPTYDLQIFVGHYDLYFIVHWICPLSWRLFDVWKHTFRLWVNMTRHLRSLWPIFHGPMILPYILKTVWCMNILLRNYESVWPDVWPKNKCRSLWPMFNGPVILPYILKTIWCMNIILWDYESVWHDIWPQNKCRSLWPIFHGPVILPISWRLFDIWTPYFGIMSQHDPMFYLKIFVVHCDLYSWFSDFA